MKTKQTALQWYMEQCENIKYNPLEKKGYTIAKEKIINQAIEIERDHIEQAYIAGDQGYYRLEEIKEFAKDYYIETYGGQDE